MHTVSSINGRLVNYTHARISIYDNSFLYAEGLFETMLGIDNRLLFLNEHLDRLYRGAKVIKLAVPVNRDRLERWLFRTTKAHPDRVKKVRLTVTSGESERWLGKAGKPQVIVYVSPHTLPTKPFRLYVSGLRVDHRSIFRQIKTLSYSIHAAALREAQTHKCDDALLLNEAGRLAEVTSANLFWVKRKRVFTPPLSAGCLDGVTRAAAIRQLRILGLEVAERDGTIDALATADEVFISSSLKLVIGVSAIVCDAQTIKVPGGQVARTLLGRFSEQLGLPR